MNALIKWPGGKAREIKHIERLIPSFERYIEPFFGGGAMFFFLKPKNALINDISNNLMEFYGLVKRQDNDFQRYLRNYDALMTSIINGCDNKYDAVNLVYNSFKKSYVDETVAKKMVVDVVKDVLKNVYVEEASELILEPERFEKFMVDMYLDKVKRTIKNERDNAFSDSDLKENLITGFANGVYMYFRDIYNRLALGKLSNQSVAYRIANFYFIREYCYGSMFRYNKKGEFNIPYGGMSYNRKDFKGKIDKIFTDNVSDLFKETAIHSKDFADFIEEADLTDKDFMFLDPPYDTEFSDYEGLEFSKGDQKRLAEVLEQTRAKFILIIKNTEYIYSLYKDKFRVLGFDKQYTYNVRSRNERKTEHLIITNIEA